MKKIIIVLVVLFLVFGIFYFTKTSENNTKGPVATATLQGCYVAKLAKDVYTLDIQSEEKGIVTGIIAYNNYQKDSSSGTFNATLTNDILLGNYSFDSEGMHSNRQLIFKKVGNNFIEGFGDVNTVGDKEMLVNANNVTYDPNSTFVKNADCTEHFTDSNNTFTFSYNSFFQANEGSNSSLDWRSNTTEKGTLLTSVLVPKSYMPIKTNFSDARFTVGRSTDTKALKDCLAASNGEVMKTPATISGFPFNKTVLNDAGAGNFYETTSYRGIVGGSCYAIEYTIHSTNIGNYSPDQGVTEFDKSKIQNELENMIASFKFLTNTN